MSKILTPIFTATFTPQSFAAPPKRGSYRPPLINLEEIIENSGDDADFDFFEPKLKSVETEEENVLTAVLDASSYNLESDPNPKPKKSRKSGKKQKPTPKEKKFGIAKLKTAEEKFVAKNKLFDNENQYVFPGLILLCFTNKSKK